jgi:hypothetical protein
MPIGASAQTTTLTCFQRFGFRDMTNLPVSHTDIDEDTFLAPVGAPMWR